MVIGGITLAAIAVFVCFEKVLLVAVLLVVLLALALVLLL